MDYGIDFKVQHFRSVIDEYQGNLEELMARAEEQEKELQNFKKKNFSDQKEHAKSKDRTSFV